METKTKKPIMLLLEKNEVLISLFEIYFDGKIQIIKARCSESAHQASEIFPELSIALIGSCKKEGPTKDAPNTITLIKELSEFKIPIIGWSVDTNYLSEMKRAGCTHTVIKSGDIRNLSSKILQILCLE